MATYRKKQPLPDLLATKFMHGLLESVSEEVQETLIKTAHSSLITEIFDVTERQRTIGS